MNHDRYRNVENALWTSLDISPIEREVPLVAALDGFRCIVVDRPG